MTIKKKITIEYFALLAQEAGKSRESLSTSAETLEALFEELKGRYLFSLSDVHIIASINSQLSPSWNTPLSDGDHILFLTPLAGG